MVKRLIVITLFLLPNIFILAQENKGVNWPSFRGENASGISEGFATPVSWNLQKEENIKWKTEIPGLGFSSPVIWGDKLFITTAISSLEDPELKVGLYGSIEPVKDDTEHEWKIFCIDKKSGKIIWEKTSHTGIPKVKRHPKSTHANSSPATNGKYVVAFFGSEGLYCYDMNGKLIWKKDFGILDSGFFMVKNAQWGFASSPIIHEDKVVVQCDVQENSFIAALNLKTGKEIWKMQGGGDIPVPTPVIAHGLIYINSAHGRMSPIYAIKPGAQGDISLNDETSNNYIAWSIRRGGAYMQTPVIYGDYLYNLRGNGSLICFDAKTGGEIYKESVGDMNSFSASGVAADGKLYFPSEQGNVFVIKAVPKFELLSTNKMNDICMASPAISEGVLFVRTHHYLVAVFDK